MPTATLETILLERQAGVALITLNRPERRNAYTRGLRAARLGELAILTQIAWGLIIVETDGVAGRLYPFVWAPANLITTVQYSIIQALEVGLGVLIGAFVMGLFSDRYGRRPAMLAAALLAGVFVWPFAFVNDFWGLVVLSVLSTLGVGAIVATHAVYMLEIISPTVRNKVLLLVRVWGIRQRAAVLEHVST